MTEQFVFESPHVSALMDVGQARLRLEAEAKDRGAERFGVGYHDFIGGEPLTSDSVNAAITTIMSQDPDCWSSICRAALMVVQGSQDHAALKRNVEHLAVLSIAWIEDLNARGIVGVEP